LLHEGEKNAQSHENGDGEVVGQNRRQCVHGLNQFIEILWIYDGGQLSGVDAVARFVVILWVAEKAAEPFGSVVVEAGDDWATRLIQSLVHNI
jgi:hypothetical protein